MVSPDHVWDAFLLHSLLEDVLDREEFLVVTHTGDQHSCFTELVQACNHRMRINGQPEISYFCNRCTQWYHGPDGQGRHHDSNSFLSALTVVMWSTVD